MGDFKMSRAIYFENRVARMDTESDGNWFRNNTLFFFRPQKDPPLPMKEAFWSQPKIGVSLQLRGSKLKIFENTTRWDQRLVIFIRGFKRKTSPVIPPFQGLRFSLVPVSPICLQCWLIFGGMAIFVEGFPLSKVFEAAGGKRYALQRLKSFFTAQQGAVPV